MRVTNPFRGTVSPPTGQHMQQHLPQQLQTCLYRESWVRVVAASSQGQEAVQEILEVAAEVAAVLGANRSKLSFGLKVRGGQHGSPDEPP